jgi:hypothetical protein
MENQDPAKQAAQEMNDEAIARIKAEEQAKAAEAIARAEVVWFEDDDQITLRDGSVRKIPPLTIGEARRFMTLVKTVNIDAIILNFAPGADKSEADLYDILSLAFKNYPDMVTIKEDSSLEPKRAYMDRVIDIRMARHLIDTMLDLNALKK